MNLDYAIAMAYHDGIYLAGAYAAEDEDMSIEGDEVGDSVEEDRLRGASEERVAFWRREPARPSASCQLHRHPGHAADYRMLMQEGARRSVPGADGHEQNGHAVDRRIRSSMQIRSARGRSARRRGASAVQCTRSQTRWQNTSPAQLAWTIMAV